MPDNESINAVHALAGWENANPIYFVTRQARNHGDTGEIVGASPVDGVQRLIRRHFQLHWSGFSRHRSRLALRVGNPLSRTSAKAGFDL